MPRLPRSAKIALLAATAFVLTGTLSGAVPGERVARAAYMADKPRTARVVRPSIDPDDASPAPFVRLDLNDSPRIDALPLPMRTVAPQRPVRVDLAEPPEPVAVLAPAPRRVVRLSLDGVAPVDAAPRVFHSDLDDATTFTPSAGPLGGAPTRPFRSDL